MNNPVIYSDPTGHMRVSERCGLNSEECNHIGKSSGWIGVNRWVYKASTKHGAMGTMGTQTNSGMPWNINFQGRDRPIYTSDDYNIVGGTQVRVQNGFLVWTGSPITFGVSPGGVGTRSTLPTDSPFGSATSAIDTNLNANFGYTKSVQSDVLNGVVSSTGLDLPSDIFTPWNLSVGTRISVRFHVGDDIDVGITSRMTFDYSARPDKIALVAATLLLSAVPEFGPAAIDMLKRIGETLTRPGGNLCPGGMCPP